MKKAIWFLIGWFGCLVFIIIFYKPNLNYWAILEDGQRISTDDLIVVPITIQEDVNGIWPEYVIEFEITFPLTDEEIPLYSKPFILCENPEIRGNAKKDVYYVPAR